MEPKEILARARLMAAKMRKAGVPETDIDQYLQAEVQLSYEQVMSPDVTDYLRAAGMGATFGFLDELAGAGAAVVPGGKGYTDARDAVREQYEGASAAAPKRMLAAEVGGGLAGSLAGAGAVGLAGKALGIGAKALPAAGTAAKALPATGTAAKAARAALTGAGAGGAAGAGYSDEMAPGAILGGAAGGAVAGGLIPVAGAAGGKVAGGVRNLVNPGRAVAREAAEQLPPDAVQMMARQEALAPGTARPAALSDEMTGLISGVGADPVAARAAKASIAESLKGLRQARESIGARYGAHYGTRLKVTPEVDAVLRKNGTVPAHGTIDVEDVHKLRTKLRSQAKKMKDADRARPLKEQKKLLDNYLRSELPEFAELDTQYSDVIRMLKAAEAAEKEIKRSSKNFSKMRAYGYDANSVAGSTSLGSKRGLVDRALGMLEPNPADRARAAHGLLMQPTLPKLPRAASAVAGQQAGGLLSGGRDLGMGWLSGRVAGGLLGQ